MNRWHIKPLLPALALFLALALLLGSLQPTAAQNAGLVQLFYEDFEGDLAENGWQLAGSWEQPEVDGSRVLAGAGAGGVAVVRVFSTAVLLEPQFGGRRYELSHLFRTEAGIFDSSVMLAINGEVISRYYVRLQAADGVMQMVLYRESGDGEAFAVAETGSIEYDPGSWYKLRFRYEAGRMAASVLPADKDSVLLNMTYSDRAPLPPGGLALQVQGGQVLFDNLEILEAPEGYDPQLPGYVFSGRVFQGDPFDPQGPLPGVVVQVFGANDPFPAPGEFLGEAQTDGEGYYEVVVPEGYEFYSIREVNPPGFGSTGAVSAGGVDRSADWIEYVLPLEWQVLTDNDFFDIEQAPFGFSGEVSFHGQEMPLFPLAGAEVMLFGAGDPHPAEGERLAGVITGEDGRFELFGPAGYAFYSLRVQPPPGYAPYTAETRGGLIQDPDWIEFPAGFMEVRVQDGNNFYLTTADPPEWGFPSCAPAEELLLANESELGEGWILDDVQGQAGDLLVGQAVFPGEDWQDYRLQFGYLFGEQFNDELRLHLRLSDAGSYFVTLSPDLVSLGRMANGEVVAVEERELPLPRATWHLVEVGVNGGRVWLAIDGRVALEWLDPDPLPAGGIGLDATAGEGDTGRFEVLWVCGQPPQAAQVTEPPPATPITPEPTEVGLTPEPTEVIGPTTPTNGNGIPGLLPLLVGVVVLGGLAGGGLLLFRGLRGTGGSGGPGDPGRPLPPTPGLPPIRLANAWLTEGAGGQGKPLDPDLTPLVGGGYTLHVQIQPRQQPPPEGGGPDKDYLLDVVFYMLEGDFAMPETRRVRIPLPARGPSQEIQLNLLPRRSGARRVRVGIYYRNVLLQSLYVDMQVAEERRRQAGAIQRGLDYVASSRFANLEVLGQPVLSIFTNQAPDGTHWVGLFSGSSQSPAWLQQGAVHDFPENVLRERSVTARHALSTVAGTRINRMDYDLPLDEATLDLREQDLVGLAVTGYRLFDALFFSTLGSQKKGYLRSLVELLAQPGSTISIARCRDEGVSFPWSGLYSYDLEVDNEDQLKLCPVFKGWLGQNTWQDRTHPEHVADFLDDPQACRARVDCPLGTAEAGKHVCPFGFWGFMHQVEQPLQLVQPTPVNEVPQEVQDPGYESGARILVHPGEQVRLGMGVYAGFRELAEHQQDLRRLADPAVLALESSENPDQVKRMLTEGGRHLLYFFCHGESSEGVFRLRVGTPDSPGLISSAGLNPLRIEWPEQPRTLVFLNGCESMAITPELVHGFMGKLRMLGASGVIGVEIKNWSAFAAAFAERLLEDLLDGRTAGEAFLNTRRIFLRQGNPLGLVYSLNAPAFLHLHQASGCAVCAAAGVQQDQPELVRSVA
jgi:hypothetical protein